MNKAEKLICVVLGAVLAWYLFTQMGNAKKQQAASGRQPAASSQQPTAGSRQPVENSTLSDPKVANSTLFDPKDPNSTLKDPNRPYSAPDPSAPERIVTLENDEVKLELSTWGAVVKSVTLKRYAKNCGPVSAENPAVVMDFSGAPLGAGDSVEAFEVVSQSVDTVVFKGAVGLRTVTVRPGYLIDFRDAACVSGTLSLGAMRMGDSKNDLLSVDSWALDAGKGKPGVVHHSEGDSPLKGYLAGSLGGCGGSKNAAGLPAAATVDYPGGQRWIAAKNRFFVTALVACDEPVTGFSATVKRDVNTANYRPESVAVRAKFDLSKLEKQTRLATFYVGPKKQALLWDLGMKDVMEFGMWRWICYPLVWVLNLFYGWIPNFGVAIILLTIAVRLIFWPLTRKSTEGMKKMQEVQPLMKEIQAKYKDNPQRLQQETWALYREKKVNPMSSCLPMLIQIPVFIALFNVLRSAVELRYAPFLWIADLSEPEGLFASWFPFGGLNLLPIAMAATMMLQTALTPSTGDRQQQKMMMVFMPVMMLFMFYSFPSALSLYWFLSNILSIVQMWLIRRETAKKQAVEATEVIDPPTPTRQMRRHR